MPVSKETLDRDDRTAEVVRDDRVGVEVPRRPVDEHESRSRSLFFEQIGVIAAGRNDDDSVYASVAERSDQLALPQGVFVAASGEDEHAACASKVFDRPM